MKRVILMRHAKSSWANSDMSDHQRPLNARGRKDAPIMAKAIKEKQKLPDLLLVSDSNRTSETRELIASELGLIQTRFMSELYLASASTLMSIIMQTDPLIDTVMVLAHNPGITEAFYLLGGVEIDNVPTSGVGCLCYEIDDFKDISPEKAKLDYFLYPKML